MDGAFVELKADQIAIAHSCAQAWQWRAALDVVGHIDAPDTVALNIAINAHGAGGRWQRATHALEQMSLKRTKAQEGARANLVSFNSLLAQAARTPPQWRWALQRRSLQHQVLLSLADMEAAGHRLDVVCINSAVAAGPPGALGSSWQRSAATLRRSAQRGGHPGEQVAAPRRDLEQQLDELRNGQALGSGRSVAEGNGGGTSAAEDAAVEADWWCAIPVLQSMACDGRALWLLGWLRAMQLAHRGAVLTELCVVQAAERSGGAACLPPLLESLESVSYRWTAEQKVSPSVAELDG
eukprot:Skav212580  [mRNA]  locus=scaffold125:400171:408155:- [translate_table: standard]